MKAKFTPVAPLLLAFVLVAAAVLPPLVFPSLFKPEFTTYYIAAVICAAVCCMGALGLAAWFGYLEAEQAKKQANNSEKLEKDIEDLKKEIRTPQTPHHTPPPDPEKVKFDNLLLLAEKLRTKTTTELEKDKPPTQIIDTVPDEIIKLIIQNMPKS